MPREVGAAETVHLRESFVMPQRNTFRVQDTQLKLAVNLFFVCLSGSCHVRVRSPFFEG